MTTRVEKWGDDLAVRIPQAFAEESGITEGSKVELKIQGSSIKIILTDRTVPTLEELVAGITEENIHPEIDWGPPVGKEIW